MAVYLQQHFCVIIYYILSSASKKKVIKIPDKLDWTIGPL